MAADNLNLQDVLQTAGLSTIVAKFEGERMDMSSSPDSASPPVTSLSEGEAIRLAAKTTDIDVVIALTKHASPRVRQLALKEMCPCHVQNDLTEFWTRVLEMCHDEDKNVRYQALHDLCDGSPTHMESDVLEALQIFNRDPDPKIRRKAHQVLASYRTKGKWNIM